MNHNFKAGDLALVVGGHEFRLGSHVKRGGWVIELDSAVVVKLPENLMPLQHDFSFERQQAVEVAA